MNIDTIKVIAFDADDTLWVNEPHFREAESKFCKLLNSFMDEEELVQRLYETEIKNIKYYGYGAKSFIFSMLETAISVNSKKVNAHMVQAVIALGNRILDAPIELLPHVKEVLGILKEKNYKLVVATKGDLFEQESKLKRSNLGSYFHHVEVLSEKNTDNYKGLFKRLEIQPSQFLMIGNSLKSDIVPVVELGGCAIHIPFHTTWIYEEVEDISHLPQERFVEMKDLIEVIRLFNLTA